jgi:glycosyltransferase involved in cell wall biosynthesis
MLTSSFPSGPDDETCGYIRDFARVLSADFDIEVLAPPDLRATSWPEDSFKVKRSRSMLPRRFDPLQAGRDFNGLGDATVAVKFAALLSLSAFFIEAAKRAARADLICSHWLAPSGLAGALLSRALKKPHVTIEHSGALHMLARLRGGRALARFIIRGSNRVITVSDDLRRKLTSLCPASEAKTEIIPMGIVGGEQAEAAGSGDTRARRVLFVGRHSEIKGVDVLLKAAALVGGLELIIAGDGERRSEYESLARDLGLNARFPGRISAAERDELFRSSDVVAIPSIVMDGGRTEGMPVICLEAMASGIAVVAARAGGLAEIVCDGHNGLLCEPGDPRSLANTLRIVLGSVELRRKLGYNARLTARQYEWPALGPRFSRVLREVLEENDSFIRDKRYETGSAGC